MKRLPVLFGCLAAAFALLAGAVLFGAPRSGIVLRGGVLRGGVLPGVVLPCAVLSGVLPCAAGTAAGRLVSGRPFAVAAPASRPPASFSPAFLPSAFLSSAPYSPVFRLSEDLSDKTRTCALARAIRALTDTVRATVGVAVVFGEGDTLVVNDRPHYPMMSVVKFHQALAVLDTLARCGLPLTTAIPVSGSDLLSGTWSPLRDKRPEGGYDLSVAELLTYSVAQSDNNVCDLLFRFLGGPQVVNRYIASLGIGDTQIVADERTMHRHTDAQYLNRTSPLAAVRLLERFRRGELLPAEYTDFLVKTMFATVTGPGKLRGLLPSGVAVAHKTGSAARDAQGVMVAENDVGFVRLTDGRSYSIAVFVMDSREDDQTNAAVIARISRLVYDFCSGR